MPTLRRRRHASYRVAEPRVTDEAVAYLADGHIEHVAPIAGNHASTHGLECCRVVPPSVVHAAVPFEKDSTASSGGPAHLLVQGGDDWAHCCHIASRTELVLRADHGLVYRQSRTNAVALQEPRRERNYGRRCSTTIREDDQRWR